MSFSNSYKRIVSQAFEKAIKPQKVLILLGARRVGKTELIRAYLSKQEANSYLLFNGEDQQTIDLFSERSVARFNQILGDCRLLIIDEAQKIPDIGLKLKLMVDEIKGIKIIVTGSSMFDLTNKLGEPLVGRENTMYLYPLAQMEFKQYENSLQTASKLEEKLVFGAYPEIQHIVGWDEKQRYLDGLINSYLLKDVLAYDGVRKSNKIFDLLRLIAFQVGSEVNLDELANSLKGISRNTIESYLDLLSKVFIIYNVRGYNRNLRKEVTKSSKWYFYDNGIRNAIIRNFSPVAFRDDIGRLWENYLMSERIKFNSYKQKKVDSYFWRTYDQQEIDLIEESGNELKAFEFKWNSKKKVKAPGAWTANYPQASFEVLDKDNYLRFIDE